MKRSRAAQNPKSLKSKQVQGTRWKVKGRVLHRLKGCYSEEAGRLTKNNEQTPATPVYRDSVVAFNFAKSLSNETTTLSGADDAASRQSTISAFDASYFISASRISDLSGLTIPEKFNIRLNVSAISCLGIR